MVPIEGVTGSKKFGDGGVHWSWRCRVNSKDGRPSVSILSRFYVYFVLNNAFGFSVQDLEREVSARASWAQRDHFKQPGK